MTANFIDALRAAGLKDVVSAADGATLRGHLHTGNLALNWITSGKFYGGWPLGHISEIYGDPSTGKSFLTARAIAEALKAAGLALLDDTESAFNNVWASTGLGVDTSALAYRKSHTIEEHYDLCIAFIKAFEKMKTTAPSVLVCDSIALLSTKEEIEQGFKKENMKRAKEIRKLLRLCALALNDLPCAYLVANHMIASMDAFRPGDSTGGGGLKFQSTVRLELRTPSRMKDKDGKYVGVKINAFVQKNRLCPPWRQCHMIIPFYEPISPVSGLVALLLDHKALELTSAKRPTLVYQEEDTKIPAHSSDFWKQDNSALDLLSKYPEILRTLEADKTFGVPKQGSAMLGEGQKDDEDVDE